MRSLVKSFSIRTQIFVATTGVLLLFVLVGWATLGHLVNGVLDAERERGVVASWTSSQRYMQLKRTVLAAEVRSRAEAPWLLDALRAGESDPLALRSAARDLAAQPGPPMVLADAAGVALTPNGPGTDRIADRDLLQRMQGGEVVDSVALWGGRPHLTAYAPIRSAGRLLGVLAIAQPIDDLLAFELAGASGRDVTVVRAGRVIASGSLSGQDGRAGDWIDALETWGYTEGSGGRVVAGEREYLASAMPLLPGDTTLVLSRPLESVLGPYRSARRSLGLFGAAILLFAVLVCRGLAAHISRPICELTRAADDLAQGRLNSTVEIEGQDEIAVLGRHFNLMAERIRVLLSRALEKTKAAERANAAKSTFLATMSHELRTPLNAVLGFADLLDETGLSRDQAQHVGAIRRGGAELLDVLAEILEFTDLEAGTLEFAEKEFVLAELLERSLETCKAATRAKGLTLEYEVAEGVPAHLMGAVEALRSLLKHFLDNALKFTERGGIRILVELTRKAGAEVELRITVADTGIGIPSEHAERLFEPFSQFDSSSRRAFGGAGLGLAICRDLAEGMGGTCGVESELGQGSRFWFTARLRATPGPEGLLETVPAIAPARPQTPSAEDDDEPCARGRILVAEDNPLNQRLCGLVLGKAGWEVEIAADGEQAIDRFESGRFDLILMDCQMPVLDGFEATRRIRTSEAGSGDRVPILALTANVTSDDREACEDAGMDDFIGKPFDAAELIEVVEHWLVAARQD